MAEKSPFDLPKEVGKEETKKRRFLQRKPAKEIVKSDSHDAPAAIPHADPQSQATHPPPVPVVPAEPKPEERKREEPMLAEKNPFASSKEPDNWPAAKEETKKPEHLPAKRTFSPPIRPEPEGKKLESQRHPFSPPLRPENKLAEEAKKPLGAERSLRKGSAMVTSTTKPPPPAEKKEDIVKPESSRDPKPKPEGLPGTGAGTEGASRLGGRKKFLGATTEPGKLAEEKKVGKPEDKSLPAMSAMEQRKRMAATTVPKKPEEEKKAPAKREEDEGKAYLDARRNKSATMFQKFWRGFICRKHHKEEVQKLKIFAIKHIPKTNILGDVKSKPTRSIIKSHTEENVAEHGQRKRVRFQEGSPGAKKQLSRSPGRNSSRKEEKRRKSPIVRPLSSDELQSDIRKRLDKVLVKVDELVQREESTQSKKPNPKAAPRSPRLSPQRQLEKADFTRFFQRAIIPELIAKAVVYGESLILSREIQHKFEQRPVLKDVFAMMHEFQYDVVNPLPHSLNCIGSLGRVLYIEAQGNLRQIDITAEKQLSPYFLGIRMPLRYTPIIDTICDTKSCRIYTLNALWKLEVWSLEQLSSLPIKRVPMVNCEVTKDFVEQAYKSRFQLAKPTFLSMADCANQILIVNTTCVDGNIVFVDPISLSIIRRIHLLFSDYEVPGHIKDAIDRLVDCVKDAMKTAKPESVVTLLRRLATKDTCQLTYQEFADRMRALLPGVDQAAIVEICHDIDADNKGHIMLDEVLPYIDESAAENKEARKSSASATVVWADWLISENKVFQAKQVLAKLIEAVEKQGISPEGAFATFVNEGGNTIGNKEFAMVLGKLCPDLKTDEMYGP